MRARSMGGAKGAAWAAVLVLAAACNSGGFGGDDTVSPPSSSGGAGAFAVDASMTVRPCAQSVAAFCAAPPAPIPAGCITEWARATDPASWPLPGDECIHVGTQSCLGFDVIDLDAPAAIEPFRFFYDGTTGALVAVLSGLPGPDACLAGPADFANNPLVARCRPPERLACPGAPVPDAGDGATDAPLDAAIDAPPSDAPLDAPADGG